MNGPKAPRDPERRPFFYIMQGKSIFGSRQEDGKGIQFLYEDSGRLIGSAQIVGNLADSKELELLKTTEGFRKLVHSIGISVETKNASDTVEFIFQMYGKVDVLHGGTMLRAKCPGDGQEVRVKLSDIAWRTDDHEPGQMRFVFDSPEQMAKASVRFFLNDGYSAPEVIRDETIDFESENYKTMIEQSILATGNVRRLARAIRRAEQGEDITMAYIGGSITQGAGAIPINTECYAYRSYRYFADSFGTGENVRFIKAGVGGTPSELGMIRFDRDVIRDGILPDIVIVEFAVNDAGDETNGDCYESLVRKVLMLPNQPAVLLLFSVFANDYNLQERLIPIGKHYELPMVSMRNAVTPQFYFRPGEGRILSKNQYFYDAFHPSNSGHRIMADCIGSLFQKVRRENTNGFAGTENTEKLLNQTPVIGCSFDTVKLLDKADVYSGAKINYGGFCYTDTDLQCVEMDCNLTLTPQFPYNWMYDGTKSENTAFSMEITCNALLLIYKDSGEMDAARAAVCVDGVPVLTADPKINGWTHCNPVILLNEKESKIHNIQIQIAKGDEKKKFTILGFGYTTSESLWECNA